MWGCCRRGTAGHRWTEVMGVPVLVRMPCARCIRRSTPRRRGPGRRGRRCWAVWESRPPNNTALNPGRGESRRRRRPSPHPTGPGTAQVAETLEGDVVGQFESPDPPTTPPSTGQRGRITAEAAGTVETLTRSSSQIQSRRSAHAKGPREKHPGAFGTAEAAGFEPAMGFESQTRLAGGRHRPD